MDKKLKPGVMPDLDGALHLKLVRGEGDQGEPVLTIVMDED
ncbi:Hypothetical protein CAP_2235 [Chondromyces apiculatus DSM 436]|uniref:Uncharacterized protein n=2 Tax=Chondromyces apiculatus TaxID=51 RepID=A0A017TB74_9BACT|nr:Hypothetical protein CAP_2235 [Chondromyces apiculatus DSM 436]